MPLKTVPNYKHLSKSELERLARRQLADYDARRPGTIFAEPGIAIRVDDAYRLQIETARLRQARGETVAGYKIGCVSQTIRRQLGIEHPVFGHVFRNEVRRSPAMLQAARFSRPAIEGEFAVTLAEDILVPGEVRQMPQRFVAEVFPVIELHNYVFRGPSQSAGELVANNALHAGIVAPAVTGSFKAGQSLQIRVGINSALGDQAAVDPLETLAELVLRLDTYGIRPRKGDILLTGSPLPLYPINVGDRVRIESPGLAEVKAAFE